MGLLGLAFRADARRNALRSFIAAPVALASGAAIAADLVFDSLERELIAAHEALKAADAETDRLQLIANKDHLPEPRPLAWFDVDEEPEFCKPLWRRWKDAIAHNEAVDARCGVPDADARALAAFEDFNDAVQRIIAMKPETLTGYRIKARLGEISPLIHRAVLADLVA